MRFMKFIKRCLAYWQVRQLEIELEDKRLCLEYVETDLYTREVLKLTMCRVMGELAQARAHYTSLLPPGERMTWRNA